jgi:ABC-type hemin transport system ATPase subunit
MKKPDILILNRACAALPAREQEAILLTLLEDPPDPTGKRRGIVCMPADPGHASFFDRVIILEGGSVVADGRPADVLDRSAEASPVAGAV